MQAVDRAEQRDQARPPRGEHEVTVVHSYSTSEARAALQQPAGIEPEPKFDDDWSFDPAMPLDPIVGPAGHTPILTPDSVRRGPAWTADFVFNALSVLGESVVMWPELLCRPWSLGRKGRGDTYWNWVRIDEGERAPMQVVGYAALDALLAACWTRTDFVRKTIDAGRYIRVPFLLIGHDKRADFPVLYRSPLCDVVTLHTFHRRREDLRQLKECTLTVHCDRT